MPEPITQPASWKIGDPPPRAAAGVPPRDPPPVVVHIARIDVPFNDIFVITFKVVVSLAIVSILAGLVVGALILVTGNS